MLQACKLDNHFLMLLATGASSSSSSTAVASGQTSKPSSAPAQALELDADELLTYKRRLLDLLQPRETVLAALRRLGGRQQPLQGGADALPWKRARKSAGASRLPRPFQCSPTHVRSTLSQAVVASGWFVDLLDAHRSCMYCIGHAYSCSLLDNNLIKCCNCLH